MAAGEIDPQLDPAQTASWLLVMTDGTLGRELTEPQFSQEAFLCRLRVLLKGAEALNYASLTVRCITVTSSSLITSSYIACQPIRAYMACLSGV